MAAAVWEVWALPVSDPLCENGVHPAASRVILGLNTKGGRPSCLHGDGLINKQPRVLPCVILNSNLSSSLPALIQPIVP